MKQNKKVIKKDNKKLYIIIGTLAFCLLFFLSILFIIKLKSEEKPQNIIIEKTHEEFKQPIKEEKETTPILSEGEILENRLTSLINMLLILSIVLVFGYFILSVFKSFRGDF